MREIKFQFIYKGLPYRSGSDNFNWHKKVYTLDQLMEKPLRELSDVHGQAELIAKRQYTGLKDRGGVEIYEGDYLRCSDLMIHRISWWENQAKFCLKTWDGDEFEHGLCDYLEDWVCFSTNQIQDCDVIGNIHENPELI